MATGLKFFTYSPRNRPDKRGLLFFFFLFFFFIFFFFLIFFCFFLLSYFLLFLVTFFSCFVGFSSSRVRCPPIGAPSFFLAKLPISWGFESDFSPRSRASSSASSAGNPGAGAAIGTCTCAGGVLLDLNKR